MTCKRGWDGVGYCDCDEYLRYFMWLGGVFSIYFLVQRMFDLMNTATMEELVHVLTVVLDEGLVWHAVTTIILVGLYCIVHMNREN